MRSTGTARAHEAGGQGRAAVGAAVLHVQFVGKFVHHHIGAMRGALGGAVHVAPAQHDRAALHGFAHQVLVVVVHHAGGVGGAAACHHRARVHHDGDKVAIPAQRLRWLAPVQQRQAGLRGNRHRHGIGHHQPLPTMELLAVQKQGAQGAQLGLFLQRERKQKRVMLQRLQPQGRRNVGHRRHCAAHGIDQPLPPAAQHQQRRCCHAVKGAGPARAAGAAGGG